MHTCNTRKGFYFIRNTSARLLCSHVISEIVTVRHFIWSVQGCAFSLRMLSVQLIKIMTSQHLIGHEVNEWQSTLAFEGTVSPFDNNVQVFTVLIGLEETLLAWLTVLVRLTCQ